MLHPTYLTYIHTVVATHVLYKVGGGWFWTSSADLHTLHLQAPTYISQLRRTATSLRNLIATLIDLLCTKMALQRLQADQITQL